MVYLLDSNTIIDYLSNQIIEPSLGKLHDIINNGFFISVITKIEVLGFSSGISQIDESNEKFIDIATIFELSPDIVKQTIALRKLIKIKLPDAIIASTALVYNMTLLTHNISDFNKIPDLIVLDPHSL
jgi:predicted nucleic acid-binding protein